MVERGELGSGSLEEDEDEAKAVSLGLVCNKSLGDVMAEDDPPSVVESTELLSC